MSDPIFQLAYLSKRNEVVTDEDIVDGIVLPAITKNRNLGVTGCLWFDHQHFFQVLEGTREAIEGLFAIIADDARHATIQLLLTEDTGERRFERFSLRAVRSDAARSMPTLIDAFTPKNMNPQPEARRRWNPLPRGGTPAERNNPQPTPVARLVRTVIDEMAGWAEATPA